MEGEEGQAPQIGHGSNAALEGAVLRGRRKSGSRSKRDKRSQAFAPQLVRIALWLWVPIVLWSALYVVIMLFEP